MPVQELDRTEEVDRAECALRPSAQRSMSDPAANRLETIYDESGDASRLSAGDRVVQRHGKGRGYEFEPPARIDRVDPVDSGPGVLLFIERRKRLRRIGSKELRARLGPLAKHFVGDIASERLVRSGDAVEQVTALWPVLGNGT